MFNSFSFSELLTILVIIVIVFGPNRLPEMARKLGEWTARARRSLDSLKTEIGTDYKDVIDPIRGARDDLRGLRQELSETARSVVADLDEAAGDVRKAAGKLDGVRRGGPSGAPGGKRGGERDAEAEASAAEAGSSPSKPADDDGAGPASPEREGAGEAAGETS